MFLKAGLSNISSTKACQTHYLESAFLGVLILIFTATGSAVGNTQPLRYYLFESVQGAVFFTVVFLGGTLLIAEIYYRLAEGESLWPR